MADPMMQARTVPAAAPPTSPSHELRTLVSSYHSAIAIESDEEERALALVDGVGHDLGMPVFDWTLTRGMVRRGSDQVMYKSTDPAAALAGVLEMKLEAIYVLRDLREKLDDAGVSRALRDVMDQFDASTQRATVVLLGTRPELPPELHDRIVAFPLGLPSEQEYRATLTAVATSVTASGVAQVSLSADDEAELVKALRGLTLNQARQILARCALDDGVLHISDLPRLIERKTRELGTGGLLEYFPPDDNAATLGGFDGLHRWLERARVGFTPEARALNLPQPKGVLLTGVQGCGKSLAAKAIARAWGMPLLRLDAGSLYDKYIGESERNLRRVLEIAGSLSPSVLWIDEIEKAIATGSGDGPDGGLSQRLLGTLLTWMAERKDPVFLVATANDIFRLPPELMRKGRFDELFFVDLPNAAERAQIIGIHLQMRKQDPRRLDLSGLVAATAGFSGAELEQVVVGTLLGSLHSGTPVTGDAFLAEAAATVPLSTSRAEDISRLRALAAGRFVPVAG
ncbi:MAG: AAA family ATPase [Solirubrobacteraceae bacterium]|nr:AAA family ATPase [Solirubrobacteraceae bacterium]